MIMIIQRGRVGRTRSGGRHTRNRGKRRFELGHLPTETRIAEKTVIEQSPAKFANVKVRVRMADSVNLLDTKTRTFSQAKVRAVVECPANRHYIRRNVLVRGSVVETEKGRAIITSRPGQDGTVNAVLVAAKN